MTDGLLENIIQLEKQLQAEVADEQVRAQQWQSRELEHLDKSFVAARNLEENRLKTALKAREEEIQHEVEALEAQTEAWSRHLLSLDDATLMEVLKRQLAEILPGGDHDHPHGAG